MDRNEFFREATLRICGDLEIEGALHSLLLYLKDFIPVSRVFLHYYDEILQSMRIIAWAEEEAGKRLDHIVPLSSGVLEIGKNISGDRDVLLIENPIEFPFCRHMMESLNMTMSSVIFLILRSNDKLLGNFVLHSFGEPKFTEADLDLVHTLKDPLKVAMSNTLKHREVSNLKDLLADDNRYLQEELHRLSGDEIVGANFGLKDVLHKAQKVAALNSPVLLLGETGVGKDVIANFIHYSSSRNEGPFVSVNCGAIPETLIDSELFGHEKGAFTGALSQKRGRFERAHKGTIFLDEIGELPLQAQVRLLRVLQSKEIERVGGVKTIPLDIRIIAATNRDLEDMIKKQEFREDLWFRLNVFPLRIPPLRERKIDIPSLLQHFIKRKSKEMNLPTFPEVSPGALDALMEYKWPGNVRELENVVERSLILNPKGPLTFEHMNVGHPNKPKEFRNHGKESKSLDDMISRHIRKILSQTNGKVSGPDGAAAILGVNPSTLRNRMKKLRISYGRNMS